VKETAFLPGYAEQLVGLNEGDKKDITITIGTDYPFDELHGKEITLHTTVTGIKEAKLPELNNEFAAKLIPGKTIEDIKDIIRENMSLEKQQQINELKVNQIIEKLNSSVAFELPEEIVSRETQNQVNTLVDEGSRQGASDDEMIQRQGEIFSVASQRAVTNLLTNFILQEIAVAEKLTVPDTDMLSHIAKIAEQRKEPIKKVITQLQKEGRIQSIRNSLLIGRTIDFLLENANVTEVSANEIEAQTPQDNS
jgi:trigger factor